MQCHGVNLDLTFESCLGLTVRCKKLILGRDIGGLGIVDVQTSWIDNVQRHGLTLI